MMSDHISAAVTPTDLAALAAEAAAYAARARAAATLRAYRADWRDFAAWCQERQTSALPAAPDAVALYITDLARTRAVSTIRRRLASIVQAHRAQGLESPTGAPVVRQVLRGIRRAKGVAPRQKAAADLAVIRAMVAALDESLPGLRDRAILLLGFAGAFRRSELARLTVADLEFVSEGVIVTLRRSKTDQEGAGAVKGIPSGAKTRRRARCARYAPGWTPAASPPDRSSARCGKAGGACAPGRCLIARLPRWSSAPPPPQATTPPASAVTACAPDWRPPPPLASRSARLWNRPGIRPRARCGVTFGAARCSATMPPRASGCDAGRWIMRSFDCAALSARRGSPLRRAAQRLARHHPDAPAPDSARQALVGGRACRTPAFAFAAMVNRCAVRGSRRSGARTVRWPATIRCSDKSGHAF